MLAVILTILKIIGIILLIILGIIMLVLLFPFSYRIDVKIAGKSLEGHLKAWWLFRLVSFNLVFFDYKLEYALRVIGIKTPINSDDDTDTVENKKKGAVVKYDGYKENGYSSETINANNENIEKRQAFLFIILVLNILINHLNYYMQNTKQTLKAERRTTILYFS